MKIGILIGTNRPQALSFEMANYYAEKLKLRGLELVFIDLAALPPDFAFSALYQNKGKNEQFNRLQAMLDEARKVFLFVPEYNGSYPGVLKTFIDGLRYPDSFQDKKVALVGLSEGVSGNAIGLSHLSDVLSYMGANVLGLRVKLNEIHRYFDGVKLNHAVFERFIDEQIEKLLHF